MSIKKWRGLTNKIYLAEDRLSGLKDRKKNWITLSNKIISFK